MASTNGLHQFYSLSNIFGRIQLLCKPGKQPSFSKQIPLIIFLYMPAQQTKIR